MHNFTHFRDRRWVSRPTAVFQAGPKIGTAVKHAGISHAVEHLHANFHDTVRLDDVAARACLSKCEFSRRFHDVSGVTFSQYLREVRIRAAVRKINEAPYASLTRIAYESGFGTLRTFEVQFKRHIGETPRSFRAKARLPLQ